MLVVVLATVFARRIRYPNALLASKVVGELEGLEC